MLLKQTWLYVYHSTDWLLWFLSLLCLLVALPSTWPPFLSIWSSWQLSSLPHCAVGCLILCSPWQFNEEDKSLSEGINFSYHPSQVVFLFVSMFWPNRKDLVFNLLAFQSNRKDLILRVNLVTFWISGNGLLLALNLVTAIIFKCVVWPLHLCHASLF